MALEERLAEELKEAMRARDTLRRDLIRFALANIRTEQKSQGRALEEAEQVEVLRRQARRHRESIQEFQKGRREDLVVQEEAQLQVLEEYLPAQMGAEEVAQRARRVIEETGAKGPNDKGKVMSRLMPQLRGEAEGSVVNQVVTELLESLSQG